MWLKKIFEKIKEIEIVLIKIFIFQKFPICFLIKISNRLFASLIEFFINFWGRLGLSNKANLVFLFFWHFFTQQNEPLSYPEIFKMQNQKFHFFSFIGGILCMTLIQIFYFSVGDTKERIIGQSTKNKFFFIKKYKRLFQSFSDAAYPWSFFICIFQLYHFSLISLIQFV